jgi:hypothetical protein
MNSVADKRLSVAKAISMARATSVCGMTAIAVVERFRVSAWFLL